ncbi:ParB/RepB/Spo0J family partition protein [Rhodanobacter denitrificans]|uniref:ParB/RepB/Spo0J family partition protein n=1 Tax=Rhodanobacter denitrificans TaxID=666685 RepID=UPI001F3262FF|nr:ParB/RepB/Spo0J family partition protein [Rhodanobacter denitrificans]UJJ60589.1 ParB/RepB/Spo0J family partition protein [Rhodanobacter denitrificans]
MSKVSDRRKGILGSVLAGVAQPAAPAQGAQPEAEAPSSDQAGVEAQGAPAAPAPQRRSYMGGLFTGEAAGLEARVKDLEAKYEGALIVKKIDASLVNIGPFRNRLQTSYDRTRSEAFRQLAEQIKASGGNVDPVCVRVADEGYEIIYGYRRWQVCLQDSLPLLAIVFETLTDEEAMVLQYYENQSREDPSIVELGRQAADWLKEAGYGNRDKVAKLLSVSPQYVSNLALIGTLPDELMDVHPDVQTISFRSARILATMQRDNAKGLHERLQQLRRKVPIPSPAEATAFLVAATAKPAPKSAASARPRLQAEVTNGVFSIPTRELSDGDAKRLMKVLREAAKKAGFDIAI